MLQQPIKAAIGDVIATLNPRACSSFLRVPSSRRAWEEFLQMGSSLYASSDNCNIAEYSSIGYFAMFSSVSKLCK